MTVALWSVWSKRSKYLQFVLMPYFYTVLCICHLLCAQWVAVIHIASIKLRLDIGNSKKKKTVSYKIISFLIVFLAIAWHHSATSRKCVFNETCTKAMWNQSLSNIPLCVNAFCLFAKKKSKKWWYCNLIRWSTEFQLFHAIRLLCGLTFHILKRWSDSEQSIHVNTRKNKRHRDLYESFAEWWNVKREICADNCRTTLTEKVTDCIKVVHIHDISYVKFTHQKRE